MNSGFQVWINQLRLLFDDLEEILFFAKDQEGRFIYANAAHVRHLGRKSLAEVMHFHDRDFYPFSLSDRYIRDDQEVIRTGKPMVNQVEIVRNQKGEMRWHSTTKIPFLIHKGEAIGLVGITRDLHQGAVLLQRYEGLNKVIEKVEESYCQEICSEDLAKVAGISVRQLERRFKAVFAKSPRTYILEKRLEEARRRLIKGSDKITAIAMDCGFFDHSHFTKAYRARFGILPRNQRGQSHSLSVIRKE